MPSQSKRRKDKSQQQQRLQEGDSLLSPSAGNSNGVSYQQQQQAGETSSSVPIITPSYSPGGRFIERPSIRNYQDQQVSSNADLRSFFIFGAGDATLRPNIGLTNSYDDALFGMALHELLENLRMANILCALACIVLMLVSWIVRLVIVWHVGQLVLSIYLAVLSLVLLLTECMNLYNVQSMDTWLKNHFGLLRHPLGKASYIFMLSSICFGIGALAEGVIGLVYLMSSLLLVYTWCVYPEFRFLFADELQVDHDDGASIDVPPSADWSFYSVSPFGKQRNNDTEQASLLGPSYTDI